MRNHRNLLVIALAFAVPLVALAREQARGKDNGRISVGAFAVMLAGRTVGDQPGIEAGGAVDLLVKAGVPLGDLKAPLTEQKLAEILDFYGVKAKTSSPGQAVSQVKADVAIALIGAASSRNVVVTKNDRSTSPTPQTLEDCLSQPNHGQCVGCCKGFGTSATQCSQFCMQINKGSSPEPIP